MATTVRAESRLRLPKAMLENIRAHALEQPEFEVCGLLGGVEDEMRMLARCSNHGTNPRVHFRIDQFDQYKIEREFADKGCKVRGVYHSHPRRDAIPSVTDLQMIPPELFSVIYSLPDDQVQVYRAGILCIMELV